MDALAAVDSWGARTAAAAVMRAGDEVGVHGPRDAVLRWASVTKLLTGLATLVAVEEGTVDLEEPAGPPGSTLRHVLAHASGLPPDEGPALMPPERRRIYSNAGIEAAAALVESRAEMPFAEYLRAATGRRTPGRASATPCSTRRASRRRTVRAGTRRTWRGRSSRRLPA